MFTSKLTKTIRAIDAPRTVREEEARCIAALYQRSAIYQALLRIPTKPVYAERWAR